MWARCGANGYDRFDMRSSFAVQLFHVWLFSEQCLRCVSSCCARLILRMYFQYPLSFSLEHVFTIAHPPIFLFCFFATFHAPALFLSTLDTGEQSPSSGKEGGPETYRDSCSYASFCTPRFGSEGPLFSTQWAAHDCNCIRRLCVACESVCE